MIEQNGVNIRDQGHYFSLENLHLFLLHNDIKYKIMRMCDQYIIISRKQLQFSENLDVMEQKRVSYSRSGPSVYPRKHPFVFVAKQKLNFVAQCDPSVLLLKDQKGWFVLLPAASSYPHLPYVAIRQLLRKNRGAGLDPMGGRWLTVTIRFY